MRMGIDITSAADAMTAGGPGAEQETVEVAKGKEQTEGKWWAQPSEWVESLRTFLGPFTVKTDTITIETDPKEGVTITTAEEREAAKEKEPIAAGVMSFFKSIPMPVYAVGGVVLFLSAVAARRS